MGVSPGASEFTRCPTTVADVRAALDIHDLARAFVGTLVAFAERMHKVWWGNYGLPSDGNATSDFHLELLERRPEWEARIHRALYRVLIAGALLAGAYNEPAFAAREHCDPEIKSLHLALDNKDSNDNSPELGPKHFSFLEQFAVSNMHPSAKAEDAVFGKLGAWLLEDIFSDKEGRAAMAERFAQEYGRGAELREYGCDRRVCPVQVNGHVHTHAEAHRVVWELMQMLWVYEHLGEGAWMEEDIRYDFPPHQAIFRRFSAASGPPRSPKSVVVVLLGVFKAEEVFLPSKGSRKGDEPGKRVHLAAHPAVLRHNTNNNSITSVFDKIFWNSGRPNHIDDPEEETDQPLAPLRLKFFEWFLRHYLDLRLANDAFQPDFLLKTKLVPYNELMRSFGVFALDDSVDKREWACATHVTEFSETNLFDGVEILASTTAQPAPMLQYKPAP